MALLFPASQRVMTAAGLPISGGKARIYDINTTTLASVYSDEAMLTPLTNPVEADANGWLPAMFAAEGTYDIALLSAADVVLKSWNDWPTFTSSAAGSIERTLSGARVSIDGGDIGDGNIGVRYNNGNPDPDDIGGYFRIGGWDGTSADKGIIDATVVDFSQPKSVKEDSKRLTAVLETEPTAFAAAGNQVIALPNDPTGQRAWRVVIFDMVFSSTSASLILQFSQDNGATYAAGANDYAWAYIAAPTPIYGGDDNHTSISLGVTSSGASANNRSHIEFTVITPNSGTANTLVTKGTWTGVIGAGVGMGIVHFEGALKNALGRVTHAKLTASTGTIAFTAKVEALRGFGE